MSTIRTNSITDAAGTGAPDFPNGLRLNTNAVLGPVVGDAPMFACRAWVNFTGTGTVAIRASGNVSSITDNGVGDYTVNFTTAMPDANYAVVGGCHTPGVTNGALQAPLVSAGNQTTSSVRIGCVTGPLNTLFDGTHIFAAIFR